MTKMVKAGSDPEKILNTTHLSYTKDFMGFSHYFIPLSDLC